MRVLIVDDEPSVVHALGVLLDIHQIPHASAATPDEAIEHVRRGDIGLVVQDMNFGPDKTSGQQGIRLFHRIREVDSEIPVLLMTAWASLETAVKLIKEGANDYLSKPWDDNKLLATINTLLRMRKLQVENARLQEQRRQDRDQLLNSHELCGIVYESDAMHRLVSLAVNVAASDAPILITGPSGAGKEKLAEIVQANSRRKERPFLRVNVGALPEELMEAELFGAEVGAFTSATSLRVGRFEAADGGTLFLDEIDALSLAGQVKLLRVIQSGEYQRLGSSKSRQADVRIVSASNANLKAAVDAGRFREDLYYRINVIELPVPPLDQRPEDVLPLARHFLDSAKAKPASPTSPTAPTVSIGEPAQQALLSHRWEGNVRELQNRMHRAMLICTNGTINVQDLDLGPQAPQPSTAQQVVASGPPDPERTKIERALLDADGVVAHAAEQLGLSRQALYRKMEKLGIVLERRPR